jgi:hypothetical protein
VAEITPLRGTSSDRIIDLVVDLTDRALAVTAMNEA